MLERKTLEEAVKIAKTINNRFIVVNKNRILLSGNLNTKLPSYKISKNFYTYLEDIIPTNNLRDFVIDNGTGTRFYRNILTTDSFYVNKENEIISYNLNLMDNDLRELDSLIDKNNILSTRNKINNNLSNGEKIEEEITYIASVFGKFCLSTSFYISNKNQIINKLISICILKMKLMIH